LQAIAQIRAWISFNPKTASQDRPRDRLGERAPSGSQLHWNDAITSALVRQKLSPHRSRDMHNIFYLIGLIVVVLAIVSLVF